MIVEFPNPANEVLFNTLAQQCGDLLEKAGEASAQGSGENAHTLFNEAIECGRRAADLLPPSVDEMRAWFGDPPLNRG